MVKFGIVGLAAFALLGIVSAYFPGLFAGALTVNNTAIQWSWIALAGLSGIFYKLA